jgi:hypothetical protein
MTKVLAQDDPLEHPDIPPLDRMLEVVAGLGEWSAAELQAKSALPGWHVREAETHLVAAMCESTAERVDARLGDALDSVERLRGGGARKEACRYLRTFLPGDLQARFDLKAKCRLSRNRRWIVGSLVGAAALVLLSLTLVLRKTETLTASVVLPPKTTLQEPEQVVTKGGDDEWHARDVMEYRRAVITQRRFVWLVTIDKERAIIRDCVERHEPSATQIEVSTIREFDALGGREFFVVVIADEPFLPRPDHADRRSLRPAWLAAEADNLQKVGASESPDHPRVAEAVVAAIRRFGYDGPVEVFVSSVRRVSTVR